MKPNLINQIFLVIFITTVFLCYCKWFPVWNLDFNFFINFKFFRSKFSIFILFVYNSANISMENDSSQVKLLITLIYIYLNSYFFLRHSLSSYFFEIWSQNKLRNMLNLIALLGGIECLVLCFTYRWIFTVLLLLYSVYLIFGLETRNDQVIFDY